MRSLVISTFALAVALAPAATFAQTLQPAAQPFDGLTAAPRSVEGQPPAQQPPTQPPPQPPPAQPPAPPARTFTSDAGMFFNSIKPDKTADFEMIMGRVKEALAKSQDPVRKQQAQSWKVFKSLEPGAPLPDGSRAVLYIWLMDPAVKSADYTITKILAEAFPTEVKDLYDKLIACYPPTAGQSMVNLAQVVNFAGAPAGGGR